MNNQIFMTTDYNMFSFKKENRPVNDIHVNKLIKAIAKKDMLIDYPILVNTDYEIIDGQHRFMAAKELGIPIYFKIAQATETEDLINVNLNIRKWDAKDVVTHYANKGDKLCKEILRLSNEYNFTPAVIIYAIKNKQQFLDKIDFQEYNQYVSVDYVNNLIKELAEKYETFISFFNMKYIGDKRFVKTTQFMRSFISFFLNVDDDLRHETFKRFMKNLEKNVQKLRSCGTLNGFYELFDYIINYGKHKNAARSI